jgi:hypothetical protein
MRLQLKEYDVEYTIVQDAPTGSGDTGVTSCAAMVYRDVLDYGVWA